MTALTDLQAQYVNELWAALPHPGKLPTDLLSHEVVEFLEPFRETHEAIYKIVKYLTDEQSLA